MKRITPVIFEGYESEDGELCEYTEVKTELDRLTAANANLRAANERMREALESIAVFQGVDTYGHVAIARQAIREVE